MATVKEHLQKMHQAMSDHHTLMAKCHSTAMGKAVAGDVNHEYHKTSAALHEAAASSHDEMCETCVKGTDVIDLAKRGDQVQPLPPGLSRLAPNAPRVTAVPRHGHPVAAAANVPAQFAKLVSTEDEEESSLLRQ